MTHKAHTGLFAMVLAAVLTACGSGGPASPTGPSPSSPQSAVPPVARTNGYPGQLIGVTLYGVVYEVTATGRSPIADVTVYCDPCGEYGHAWARTDENGYYSFNGDLASGGGIWVSGSSSISLSVTKEGYSDPVGQPGIPGRLGAGWRDVVVNGDTRVDVELVKH